MSEIDLAEVARVMFEASRDRFMRPGQCYPAVEALHKAGYLRDPPPLAITLYLENAGWACSDDAWTLPGSTLGPMSAEEAYDFSVYLDEQMAESGRKRP